MNTHLPIQIATSISADRFRGISELPNPQTDPSSVGQKGPLLSSSSIPKGLLLIFSLFFIHKSTKWSVICLFWEQLIRGWGLCVRVGKGHRKKGIGGEDW